LYTDRTYDSSATTDKKASVGAPATVGVCPHFPLPKNEIFGEHKWTHNGENLVIIYVGFMSEKLHICT